MMTIAFVIIWRGRGKPQTDREDAQSNWPMPKVLMVAGALLLCLASLLSAIPGTVPWWDYSKRGEQDN